MLKHIAKYDTGFSVEITEAGVVHHLPDGSHMSFDTFGNLLPVYKDKGLSKFLKVGDYIELIPEQESVVISSVDSGYETDQKIEVGNASKWVVLGEEDGLIKVTTAKSVGKLTLSGLEGYCNCVSILESISQACGNIGETIFCRGLGSFNSPQSRVKIRSFRGLYDEPPFSSNFNREELKYFNSLGLEIAEGVWIAARKLGGHDNDYSFNVSFLMPDGSVYDEFLYKWWPPAGYVRGWSATHEVFPVLLLSPKLKIGYGDGTKDNPYRLT